MNYLKMTLSCLLVIWGLRMTIDGVVENIEFMRIVGPVMLYFGIQIAVPFRLSK